MEDTNEVDTMQYKVVINHEEQYSIWPTDRPNPAGWNDVGPSGSRDECLDYIERVWTDMRPLSVRRHLAALEQAAAAQASGAGAAAVNVT